ncbi:MAG TPA: hypothetical protein VK488_01615 [Gaiellaceae bacterium]|nr:hypothetical protein [Gaiellaceae bacterium]
MKRRRRLRKLVPDAELIRRRATGEPLRELASDYDVAHTTLGRYFEGPEVAKQLRAEQRAAASRRSAERRAGTGGYAGRPRSRPRPSASRHAAPALSWPSALPADAVLLWLGLIKGVRDWIWVFNNVSQRGKGKAFLFQDDKTREIIASGRCVSATDCTLTTKEGTVHFSGYGVATTDELLEWAPPAKTSN